ncbi:MAG: hypothetical protein SFT81_03725 [Candidatus Caenarcaniphilales bacterium]|nr:hypothetical protein [Candidatus Caenarcaniphilales bacterium]
MNKAISSASTSAPNLLDFKDKVIPGVGFIPLTPSSKSSPTTSNNEKFQSDSFELTLNFFDSSSDSSEVVSSAPEKANSPQTTQTPPPVTSEPNPLKQAKTAPIYSAEQTTATSSVDFPDKELVISNFKKYAPGLLNYELSAGKHSQANFEVVGFVFMNRLIAAKGDINKVFKAWNPGDPSFISKMQKPAPHYENVQRAIESVANFKPETDLGKKAWENKWTDYAHYTPGPAYHKNLTELFQGNIDGQPISIGSDPAKVAQMDIRKPTTGSDSNLIAGNF